MILFWQSTAGSSWVITLSITCYKKRKKLEAGTPSSNSVLRCTHFTINRLLMNSLTSRFWYPSSVNFVHIQKHQMMSHFKYTVLYILVQSFFCSFLNFDIQSNQQLNFELLTDTKIPYPCLLISNDVMFQSFPWKSLNDILHHFSMS